MMQTIITFFITTVFAFHLVQGQVKKRSKATVAKAHPCLLLSPQSVMALKNALGQYPLLDSSYNAVKRSTQNMMAQKMDVPVPLDAGGGYTHERHKQNAQAMYQAGILYQITRDEQYAVFIRDMLFAYSRLYPSLPLHPKQKEQSPGRLFWQDLNECVWLVYSIQAYDCIYNWLSEKDKKVIERDLFIPISTFLSEGSAATFNLIHNHGTWAVAAVGMTGYVLGDNELVEKSLKGLRKDGNGGFLAQLDQLFSPTGYYTEGPYYQRYALMPFVLYAQVVQNNDPGRNILFYRDSILKKAVETGLQLTYVHGEFFPYNDALKEKTWLSPELVYAVDVAYAGMGKNPQLLDVASRQGKVMLSSEGLEVARDVHHKLAKPFRWKSISFTDGPQGDHGGVGILRTGAQPTHTCIVMEYAGQGMGHGHFDRLSMMLYDNGHEILQDYGAARFLNIEPKYGGHYLAENKTWAKQSVAHNTLVVDEQSHFNGNYAGAQETHASQVFFDSSNPAFQIMSAAEKTAYPGVLFTRTMAILKDRSFSRPFILDILDVQADTKHTYDLPYYYQGHFINTSFDYDTYADRRVPLGKSHGYEHLWLEGTSKSLPGKAQFTWLKDDRFYSITTATDDHSKVLFTRIGANDPDFNLRNEPAVMIRQTDANNHTFFSVIEPHGLFDATEEKTVTAYPSVTDVRVTGKNERAIVVRFSAGNKTWELGFAREAAGKTASYQVETTHGAVQWTGVYQVREINN